MQLVPEMCFSSLYASFSPLSSHISRFKQTFKNMLPEVKTYINNEELLEYLVHTWHLLSTVKIIPKEIFRELCGNDGEMWVSNFPV